MKERKKENKILLTVILSIVFCLLFSICVFADNGYAPVDIYLNNIGEYKSTVDFTTYAIVNGDVYIDQNGNIAYEILGFNFNQSFFDRYVAGYTSIENVVTMFFSQNQSFAVQYYYYDNGNITENYFEYSSNYPPHSYYWDNYVSTFRLSLEEQFGGWLNKVDELNSDINDLNIQNGILEQENFEKTTEIILKNERIESLESYNEILTMENNSLNNQIENLRNEYQSNYELAYQNGYTKGFEEANWFERGLNSIFSSPSYMLHSFLNFEIFGINVLSIFLMVITLLIVGFIIKRFI